MAKKHQCGRCRELGYLLYLYDISNHNKSNTKQEALEHLLLDVQALAKEKKLDFEEALNAIKQETA